MKLKKSLFNTTATSFWMVFSIMLHVLSLEKNCSSSCDDFMPLCISNYSNILYIFSNEKSYLCESKQLYFHENYTDSALLQHTTLHILKNQNLTFDMDVFSSDAMQLYIYNDSFYSDWNQCNTKNMSRIHFITNDHYLQMPSLKIGKHYILFNTSKKAPLNVLRIQVNVFDHNCFKTSNNSTMLYREMCSSNGKCEYNDSLNAYTCKCCPGFVGQYCDNKPNNENYIQSVLDLKQSEVNDFLKNDRCVTCFKMDNMNASDVHTEYSCNFDKQLEDNSINDSKFFLKNDTIKYDSICSGESLFSVANLNENISFNQFNKTMINLNNSCFDCQCYKKYLQKLSECKAVDKPFVANKTFLLEADFVDRHLPLNSFSSTTLSGVKIISSFSEEVIWSTDEMLLSTTTLLQYVYRSQINILPTPSLTTELSYQSWPSVFPPKQVFFSTSIVLLDLLFETINPTSSLKQSTSYRDSIFNGYVGFSTDANKRYVSSLSEVSTQTNGSIVNDSSIFSGLQNDFPVFSGTQKFYMSSILDQSILKVLKQNSIFVTESLLSVKQIPNSITNSMSLSQHKIKVSELQTTPVQLCLYPCFQNACLNNATCFVDASNYLGFRCACTDKFTGAFCDQLKDYCLNDPCNGGFCISIDNGFKCLCQFGKTGTNCLKDSSVGIPLFSIYQNYSSFIKYSWNSTGDLNLQRLEIQLQFKKDSNRDIGELLVYSGKSDNIFFAVGLNENFITVIFNFGNGVVILKSHDKLSESRIWHYLVTGYSGKQVFIFIDNQSKVLYTCSGKLSYLDFTSPLFIGGVPSNVALPKLLLHLFPSGFIGTLYQLSLRTDNQYFTNLLFKKLKNNLTETTSIQLENSLGIDMETLSCENHLCKNNGSCFQQENVSYCSCLYPNKGALCQDNILPCVEYNPCHPSSACYSANNFDIQCDCPFGRSGLFCGTNLVISMPFFHNRSYLIVPGVNIAQHIAIEIHFKPDKLTGLLFYVANSVNVSSVSSNRDFLAIGLYDGYVLVRFNLGRSTATLLSRSCVTPSNINRLHFQRINNQAVMKLNDDIYVGVRSSPLAVSLDVNNDFYIGGVPDFSTINTDVSNEINSNFVGCVTHLKVNNKLYVLNSSNTDIVGRNIGEYNDSCIKNNCRNNASCTAEADSSYRCNCLLGFSGVYCETELKQMTVASFDGSGYWAGHIDTVSSSSQSSFALSFRSTNDGLLFWYGRLHDDLGDMISVGLYNGTINVRYMIDGKEVSSSTEQQFNDGTYHRLHILRNGNAIFVWINLNKPDLVVSHSSQVSFDTDGYIYIGGLPGDVYLISGHRFIQGWVGCIANVSLTNERSFVNFANKETASGKNVKPCN